MIRRGHVCHRPFVNNGRHGDVWMCDQCGALWVQVQWHWERIVNPLRIWWLKRNAG